MSEFKESLYHADHKAPVVMLTFDKKFVDQLTPKEQKYAHYMSKASHAGTRVVLRQVSHESEAIFDLIMDIHNGLKLKGLDYPKQGESEEASQDTQYYLEYCSQFLSNLGNYNSFGDSKFIPKCSKSYWYQLLELVDKKLDDKIAIHSDSNIVSLVENLTYKDLIETIYFINESIALLGFPVENHHSAYYFGAVSNDDMSLLKDQVFAKYGILPENCRIVKQSEQQESEESEEKIHFKILVSSLNLKDEIPESYYPQGVFTIGDEAGVKDLTTGKNVKYSGEFLFGDHSREMGKICEYLEKACEYTANDLQLQMLKDYIKHFTTGCSRAHKDSQKSWVKDLSPIVEINSGFIETYREPSGIIGEFESLVAIQNKERTKKFQELVQNGEKYIALLPWTQDFEKPKFHAPDFSSIEVLTFTGSGIPAGINIPNYDDVRLNIGFKNVSLGNILNISSKIKVKPSFIQDSDVENFMKFSNQSFEVQVALHELIGHGTGKLLSEESEGVFNFDHLNPPIGLENKPVTTYYKKGETWGSKFGAMAGAYEECRAETVAMYLLPNREILSMFGFEEKFEQDQIIYSGYLQMARAGLMGLQYWDPASNKFGQPHMRARFVILRIFLQDPEFCKIVVNEDETDFYIDLKEELIETRGMELVKEHLLKLHIYKSSGDVAQGSKYFDNLSNVPEHIAKLREIVLNKQLPRRQIIQANTTLSAEQEEFVLQNYEETPIGMLQSFVDRDY